MAPFVKRLEPMTCLRRPVGYVYDPTNETVKWGAAWEQSQRCLPGPPGHAPHQPLATSSRSLGCPPLPGLGHGGLTRVEERGSRPQPLDIHHRVEGQQDEEGQGAQRGDVGDGPGGQRAS